MYWKLWSFGVGGEPTWPADDLSRGAYTLPLPIELPADRGPLLAKVVPSYSPETGITEWGMGWQPELKIQRFQPRGEIDFATDQLSSPWGRLIPGNDGSFYPAGTLARGSRRAASETTQGGRNDLVIQEFSCFGCCRFAGDVGVRCRGGRGVA